ncbi:MAG: hypothetical protein QXE51_04615 [Nitrososphaeria archaeon]
MADLNELIANDLSVIKNSLVIPIYNITASASQTTPPVLNQANALVYKPLGNIPLLAQSIFISYNSTFAANYALLLQLEGLNIDNNNFFTPPTGSSGYDFVPTGKSYFIPAGATLRIWAYNTVSTNNVNGVFNVLAVFDKLDTYKI